MVGDILVVVLMVVRRVTMVVAVVVFIEVNIRQDVAFVSMSNQITNNRLSVCFLHSIAHTGTR